MPVASLRHLRTPSGTLEVPLRCRPRMPRRQRHPCHQGSTPRRPAKGPSSLRKWIKDCGRHRHFPAANSKPHEPIHGHKCTRVHATSRGRAKHKRHAVDPQPLCSSSLRTVDMPSNPTYSLEQASNNLARKTPTTWAFRLGRSLGASHGTTPKHGAPKVS